MRAALRLGGWTIAWRIRLHDRDPRDPASWVTPRDACWWRYVRSMLLDGLRRVGLWEVPEGDYYWQAGRLRGRRVLLVLLVLLVLALLAGR